MRMSTIRRAALGCLIVMGVAAAVGCTAPGTAARLRRDAAQEAMATRVGGVTAATVTPKQSGGGGSAGGGAAAGAMSEAAKLGQKTAAASGCVACHSIDGKAGVGPSWKGIAGAEADLADGSKVKRDDAYLKESIVEPNKKVVKGFQPNLMPPTFGTQLKPEEIDGLVEYLKTLK